MEIILGIDQEVLNDNIFYKLLNREKALQLLQKENLLLKQTNNELVTENDVLAEKLSKSEIVISTELIELGKKVPLYDKKLLIEEQRKQLTSLNQSIVKKNKEILALNATIRELKMSGKYNQTKKSN